jgi:lactobin A/cerein 7B family class IIb bacteriocin
MSVADLKEYGRRAASDPVVRQRAKEIGLQNVKGQAEYAKTLGLNFTQEDMQALAKEVEPQGELSESQLSSVAGGVVTTVAAAVVGAGVAVGTAATAVTASTSSGGW